MVKNRNQDSVPRPVKQGGGVTAPEPNKIKASTPFDFEGRNLTAYGGLLPVATMLEKLGFLDLITAAQNARSKMDQAMESKSASQVPGDTHRNLDVNTDYANQTFKHVLLPVWLLAFNYGSKTYQVLINGHTGAIAGKHPLSAVKIFFSVLSLILAAFIIYGMTNR